MNIIEVWDGYDLHTSLYPSFAYPFYEFKDKNTILMVYGVYRNLLVRFDKSSNVIEYTPAYSRDVVERLTGIWFNPYEYISKLSSQAYNLASEILELIPGLGLAIDPFDQIGIFISIYLSRNTDFHINTVRWFKKIIDNARSDDEILNINFKSIGSSYQLQQLDDIKAIIKSNINIFKYGDVVELKKLILSIPYASIKTLHSFYLFARGYTIYAPVDRHLIRYLKLIGYEDVIPPVKRYCIRYQCSKCIIRSRCGYYILRDKFNLMSGWIQTAIYLLDRFKLINKVFKK